MPAVEIASSEPLFSRSYPRVVSARLCLGHWRPLCRAGRAAGDRARRGCAGLSLRRRDTCCSPPLPFRLRNLRRCALCPHGAVAPLPAPGDEGGSKKKPRSWTNLVTFLLAVFSRYAAVRVHLDTVVTRCAVWYHSWLATAPRGSCGGRSAVTVSRGSLAGSRGRPTGEPWAGVSVSAGAGGTTCSLSLVAGYGSWDTAQ